MARVVDFRLLGPVEIWADGQLIKTSEPRRRAVLAALLVDAGAVVPSTTLVRRVWGDDASGKARNTLGTHITRIRRVLEQAAGDGVPVEVVNQPGGYQLAVDRDQVDLHRFRQLVEHARHPERTDEQRVTLLRQAIELWRGEPLTGIPGDWASRTREHLTQERLQAIAVWAGAELRVGNPAAVLAPLAELAGEHPLVEPLTAALVRALVAVGRPTEALARCRAHQQILADEYGTDQGHELRALYEAILRDDPELAPPGAQGPPGTPQRPMPAPAQLPAGVSAFAGRRAYLDQLNALLSADRGRRADGPTATTIIAVSGTAGVGKTSLAVQWAHRVADRFPDGQLYVNLRGHDPSGEVMSPAEVVRRFLDALDVPRQRIPADPDAQVALYRTMLAGRRMLLVLDNARDTAQVRPLLPGSATCLVLVTSRNQLTGLVATDGARPITLDLLTAEEGRDLLARRLDAERIAAEPEAVMDIITHCARLPLALAVVAAHAAIRPGIPLRALAAELGDPERRWHMLASDDSTSQVQAVFSWSYHVLSPPAARLFRLLGLHPGPDIDERAAASLAAVPVRNLRPRLAELVRASLLTEQTPGRFTSHDLLRAYAAELVHTEEAEAGRHEALLRLYDHHLHTLGVANRIQDPCRIPNPLPPGPPAVGANPIEFLSHTEALAWLVREDAVLLTLVRHAAATGYDAQAFQLAWGLDTFLFRQCRWDELAALWRIVAPVADRLGNRSAQAATRRLLAYAETLLGHYAEACRLNEEALDLYATIDDSAGQAKVHHNLAFGWHRQGHPERALEHSKQALALLRAATPVPALEASILDGVACCYSQLDDFPAAKIYAQRALGLFQKAGDRYGEAAAYDTLGYIQHNLGEYPAAVDCYRRALELCRDFGEPYDEATVLNHLGDTHLAAGDREAAAGVWERAVAILDELDHPDAAAARTKLRGLSPPTQPAEVLSG